MEEQVKNANKQNMAENIDTKVLQQSDHGLTLKQAV